MGLDFGFTKILKNNLQCTLNCFCSILSTFVIISIIIQIPYTYGNKQVTSLSWYINGLIQYSLHVIFLRFSKYNLYNLIVDIYSVDIATMEERNKEKRSVNLLIIFFSTMYVMKCAVCFSICINRELCPSLYIHGYLYCIFFMGMDTITMGQILIYFYIYKAVKYLNESLIDKDIKRAWKQFTAIADICDKISPTYGKLVSA